MSVKHKGIWHAPAHARSKAISEVPAQGIATRKSRGQAKLQVKTAHSANARTLSERQYTPVVKPFLRRQPRYFRSSVRSSCAQGFKKPKKRFYPPLCICTDRSDARPASRRQSQSRQPSTDMGHVPDCDQGTHQAAVYPCLQAPLEPAPPPTARLQRRQLRNHALAVAAALGVRGAGHCSRGPAAADHAAAGLSVGIALRGGARMRCGVLTMQRVRAFQHCMTSCAGRFGDI